MKHLLPCAFIALIFALPLAAQTVTTDPLALSSYCGGDGIAVSYTAAGAFEPGNAFIVQLSDPDGSFGGGIRNLGTLMSTSSGTIDVVVPSDLKGSTKYRIRVIGSNPVTPGSDNGSDLTIAAPDDARFAITNGLAAVGSRITFWMSEINPGVTFEWNFGKDAVPATSTASIPPDVIYTTPGPKTVTRTATTLAGCTSTETADIHIQSLNPEIMADAIVVRGDSTIIGLYSPDIRIPVWICPGAHATLLNGNGLIVVVEMGGRLTSDLNNSLIYVRSGGSMEAFQGYENHSLVVYEAGAGVNMELTAFPEVEVPSITVDYTNAPAGGCPSLAPYTKKLKKDIHSVIKPESNAETGRDFWIREGGTLTSLGGRNMFAVESGTVIATGDSCTVYLKKNGTFDAQGSRGHRIFHETDATIINAGEEAALFPSSGITFLTEAISGVENSKETAAGALLVSPNPSSSLLTIATGDRAAVIARVIVSDSRGETVIDREIDRTENVSISVAELPSGVYHVEAHTSHGILTRNILVTR